MALECRPYISGEWDSRNLDRHRPRHTLRKGPVCSSHVPIGEQRKNEEEPSLIELKKSLYAVQRKSKNTMFMEKAKRARCLRP